MNPNDSSVASELRPESNTSPVFRNGVVAAPDTHTARVNSAALLRASQEVGYTAVVALIDAHTPGTGVAARPKPLARQRAKSKSLTRETPATTTQGV